MDKRKQEGGMKKTKKKKTEDSDRDTKTTVTIPYFKEVSEAMSHVVHCHSITMAMKPLLTLKRMLAHPKDKRTLTVECRSGVPGSL